MRRLLSIALLAASASAQTASIEGIVTSLTTGSPLPRVHVVLKNPADNSGSQYGAETKDDGRFSIDGIAAARSYVLSGGRAGYATGRISLTLQRDEKRNNIELKLAPVGTISGRLTDSSGEPVEYGTVTIEAADRKEATTDENGHFRIGGLSPGKYRVKATRDQAMFRTFGIKPEILPDGSLQLHDAATYYPGVLSAVQARRVEVRPDTESTGIDIQLVGVPFVRLSGKVPGIPSGAAQAYATISARSLGGGAGYPIKADGSFEFWGLDPGKYTLVAGWGERGGPGTSTVPIQIEVAGSNVDHMELRVIPESDIAGRIIMETPDSPPPNAPARITLRDLNAGSISGDTAQVAPDDTFRLTSVHARKYEISVSRGGAYVRSVRLGTVEFEGGLLDLSNGSGGADLTLLLSTAVGSIFGIVHNEKGSTTEALVLLAHDYGEETLFVSRSTDAQTNGSYSFTNVPPGKYKIGAFSREDADVVLKPYGSAGFEDLMESIEVGPDGKAVIDLVMDSQ